MFDTELSSELPVTEKLVFGMQVPVLIYIMREWTNWSGRQQEPKQRLQGGEGGSPQYSQLGLLSSVLQLEAGIPNAPLQWLHTNKKTC